MVMQFLVPKKKTFGITINNKLKYREHIEDQCKKTYDKIYELPRIRFFK